MQPNQCPKCGSEAFLAERTILLITIQHWELIGAFSLIIGMAGRLFGLSFVEILFFAIPAVLSLCIKFCKRYQCERCDIQFSGKEKAAPH